MEGETDNEGVAVDVVDDCCLWKATVDCSMFGLSVCLPVVIRTFKYSLCMATISLRVKSWVERV